RAFPFSDFHATALFFFFSRKGPHLLFLPLALGIQKLSSFCFPRAPVWTSLGSVRLSSFSIFPISLLPSRRFLMDRLVQMGSSPLCMAVKSGQLEIVKLLVAYDADVHAVPMVVVRLFW